MRMASDSAQQTFKLEQCLECIVDNRGKTPPISASGIELLEVNAITGNCKSPAFENVRKYVSEETYATWFRSGHPRQGDTLISTVGAIGRVAYVQEVRGCIAQNIVALRPKTSVLDSEFLYYYLSSTATQNRLLSLNIGVAQPSLKVPHLLSLSVNLPPLPIQQRIAGILSAYDELIENSQRRIKLLEAMARALYREWFVHFRFPGHENHPRVPSPLGEIPQGWEVRTVEEIVKRIPVGKKYDQKTVSSTGTIPVLDQGKSGIIGFHDEQPGVEATESTPVIVFANHTCYQRLIHFPFSAIQNVLPFVSHPSVFRNIYWLHWVTNGLVAFNDYKGHWPEFAAKWIVVPPQDICQDFGNFAEPISRQILKLERAIQTLRRTRDLLLPRLLSGQIDVKTIPYA